MATVLAAADSAAAIASVVEALAVAALEDLAAEGPGGVDEDNAWNFPIFFLEKLKPAKLTTKGHMKKLLTLTGIASIGMVLLIISASEATAASASEISRKEALLTQSGFKVMTATTSKQKEAIKGLVQGRCSAVMVNGKLVYVFPTATKDKFYYGKQAQFDNYKKAIAAQGGKSKKM